MIRIPSNDEMAPELPRGTLSLRPPIGLVDSSSNFAHESGVDRLTNNAQTPRQSGEDLDAPSPRRARTDSQEAPIAGDNEFRARQQHVVWDRVGAFTVNEGDLQRAIRFPLVARAAYATPYPKEEPNCRLEHHIAM